MRTALPMFAVAGQVAWREGPRPLDPFAPLAVREVAVEVQVDAIPGELAHGLRMKPDRAPGDDRVDLAVASRQPRLGLPFEPVGLGQVAVEDQLLPDIIA